MTYCRGTLLGAPAASQVCKQTNYDPTRGNDGSLNLAVSSPSNSYGVDWGEQLTAGQVNHATPTNGTAVDFNGKGGAGVSTAFGIQAFLHVFALTGTTVTFTIEDSADGSTGWASIGAFTAVTTAPQAQRIQTARDQAVRRFLRVVSSGTFSSVDFAVAVDRNPVAVNF
jgi:hypothetical protein